MRFYKLLENDGSNHGNADLEFSYDKSQNSPRITQRAP